MSNERCSCGRPKAPHMTVCLNCVDLGVSSAYYWEDAPPATLEPKLGDLKSLDDCISFLADAVGLASWSLQRDYDQSCLAHLERLKVLERVAAKMPSAS